MLLPNQVSSNGGFLGKVRGLEGGEGRFSRIRPDSRESGPHRKLILENRGVILNCRRCEPDSRESGLLFENRVHTENRFSRIGLAPAAILENHPPVLENQFSVILNSFPRFAKIERELCESVGTRFSRIRPASRFSRISFRSGPDSRESGLILENQESGLILENDSGPAPAAILENHPPILENQFFFGGDPILENRD